MGPHGHKNRVAAKKDPADSGFSINHGQLIKDHTHKNTNKAGFGKEKVILFGKHGTVRF